VDPTSTDEAIEHARDADVVEGEAAAGEKSQIPGSKSEIDTTDSRHPASSFGAGILDEPS
jgi:hypothetical protein